MTSPPETDQDSCPRWLPPVPLDLVSPLEGFSPGPLNLSASLPPEFWPLPFVCFLCGTWHRAFMWKHFQLEEFIIHDCSLSIFPFCGKRGREKWKGETAKEAESSLEWVRGKFWWRLPASSSQQQEGEGEGGFQACEEGLNTHFPFKRLPSRLSAKLSCCCLLWHQSWIILPLFYHCRQSLTSMMV